MENEAEGYVQEGYLDPRIKTRMSKELDDIVEKIKELERAAREADRAKNQEVAGIQRRAVRWHVGEHVHSEWN